MSLYLNDNEEVAEADNNQRTKEAQDRGVEDENSRPHIMWFRPAHVAGLKVLLYT